MTNWYTADPHFGHENVIPFCGRPFCSASHMDAVLMENLWAKVGPDDDLWIIGDFAFGPKAKEAEYLDILFGQLPGARKHLVVGNHDLEPTQALTEDEPPAEKAFGNPWGAPKDGKRWIDPKDWPRIWRK